MPFSRRPLTAVLAALACAVPLAVPAGAPAADPATREPTVQWDGPASSEQSGGAVADVGDVNGDGLSDTAIGAILADPSGRSDAGSVYVAFGRRSTDPRALSLASGGMRINGPLAFERIGFAVAAAGDVNGDGLADVLLTTREADYNGRSNSGAAYVVFGSSAPVTVDLAALGGAGFRIDGFAAGDRLGSSAAGVGDMNADGLADVAVGASGADHNGRSGSGSVYVVYGKPDGATVDLSAPGTGGYRIDGAAPGDALSAVARLPDLTADGRAELAIGASTADPAGRVDAGSAYVVAGRTGSDPVDLSAAGSYRLRLDGAAPGDFAGSAVAAAGDPNGDGRPDLLVGAQGTDPAGRTSAGSVHVVRADAEGAVDLGGGHGWRIDGPGSSDFIGTAVAGGRDVNGDGRDDLVVGNALDDRNGRTRSGSGYVLYGGARPAVTDLAVSVSGGFRMDGVGSDERAGTAVALGRDVNGDGRADALMGAPRADRSGRRDGGTTWALFVRDAQLSYPDVIEGIVSRELGPVTPDELQRTGTAVFAVSPPLPDGLWLDPATGTVVGTPTELIDESQHVITMTDISGRTQATLTLRVNPVPGACVNERRGTDGADHVLGSRGGDRILTGAGEDVIEGGAGDDCLSGEADADSVSAGDGADILEGGDGEDSLAGGGGDDLVRGAELSDVLAGDGGNDVMWGAGGADQMDGGDGNDELGGQSETDSLDGGPGDDDLDGGDHNDDLAGGTGSDQLLGEGGADELVGETGDDRLHGGADRDELRGGAGLDALFGNTGNDRLFGDAGADLLRGDDGSDAIAGGDGADSVLGQRGADVLRGGAGNDFLDGGDQRDRLDGGPGRDVLTGGSGADRLTDTRGGARVDAGGGNDAVNVRNGRRDRVDCGGGRDVVSADRGDSLAECERRRRR